MILEYTKNNDNYNTVRQVVTGKFNISYNLLLKLKKNNKILLNGCSTYLDKEIIDGDSITISIDFEEDNSNIVPTKMDLSVLYEDEYLVMLFNDFCDKFLSIIIRSITNSTNAASIFPVLPFVVLECPEFIQFIKKIFSSLKRNFPDNIS